MGTLGAARRPPDGHGRAPSTPAPGENGLVGGVTEFASDAATLLELQARLAELDLKETAERAAVPLTLVLSAVVLGLAGVPVALLGVADLLALVLKIAPGTAKLITAAGAVGVAGLLLYASLGALTRSVAPLRRSREELWRNLAWIKTVMLLSGRPIAGRKR